jgi:hypothetical protein
MSSPDLDKNGSLKTYIEKVCIGLGFTLKNVYATNIFKYFYTYPPDNTMDVLEKHLDANLILQKKKNFPAFPMPK